MMCYPTVSREQIRCHLSYKHNHAAGSGSSSTYLLISWTKTTLEPTLDLACWRQIRAAWSPLAFNTDTSLLHQALFACRVGDPHALSRWSPAVGDDGEICKPCPVQAQRFCAIDPFSGPLQPTDPEYVDAASNDVQVFNYLLNLEYLFAEYYSCAVTGAGISAALRGGGPASVGCTQAPLTGPVAVRLMS